MRCRIDHLVLGCADLAQGERFAQRKLGVTPQPGGKHALMGTHNALLKLGARTYLELIAVDPEAPPPARPRWFGLDTAAVRARIARDPCLLAWVAACSDIAAATSLLPGAGEVIAAARGAFSWRITVPADGRLAGGGVLPMIIQWDGDAHPCDGLADCGLELAELVLADSDPQALRAALESLRVDGPLRIEQAERSHLVACIRTPTGEVELR